MAASDAKIKDEPEDEIMSDISDLSDLSDLADLDPAEGEKDGLFVGETAPAPDIVKSVLHLSTNLEAAVWHKISTDRKSTLAQKVAVNEAAIQAAISRLQELIPALEAVQQKLPTRPHVDTISKFYTSCFVPANTATARLITKYKAAVVLIGLMGSTGAGKSSMIK